MLSKLSRNGHRVLALLILLTLVTTVVAVITLPLRSALINFDDSIADLEFRLKKYNEMAQLEVPLKVRLESLTSRQETAEGLLKGESQAIAGANLQALFKQIVLSAGGRLESTQVLPGSASGVMEWIGIRAQFSGDIETLQRVLYGIEFNKPILFVDKIEIRTKRIRRSRRINPAADQAQELSVSLEVSGYRRNEESS